MKQRALLSVILILVLSSPTLFAEQSNNTPSENNKTMPPPNWSVLLDKPVKTIHKGNRTVDIFESKHFKYAKPLDYAWVSALALDDECIIIAWVHGKNTSKRITFNSKKRNNSCTVYIPLSDFEEDFRYCFLSGITVNDGSKGYNASFGGGPSGDREEYWFEWGAPDHVKPNFYCILK